VAQGDPLRFQTTNMRRRKRNEDGGAPRCIKTKPEGLIIV